MNPDALVLAFLAIADLAFLVHLRQCHARRTQMERIMANLCMAVRRENALNDFYPQRKLLPARPMLALEAGKPENELRYLEYTPQFGNGELMVLTRG